MDSSRWQTIAGDAQDHNAIATTVDVERSRVEAVIEAMSPGKSKSSQDQWQTLTTKQDQSHELGDPGEGVEVDVEVQMSGREIE